MLAALIQEQINRQAIISDARRAMDRAANEALLESCEAMAKWCRAQVRIAELEMDGPRAANFIDMAQRCDRGAQTMKQLLGRKP